MKVVELTSTKVDKLIMDVKLQGDEINVLGVVKELKTNTKLWKMMNT